MDIFGNTHIYIGRELKWIEFKMKKKKVEFYKGLICVFHSSVVILFKWM